MVFMPNKSTADYLFEKADQSCFRRSGTNSTARIDLEALGNVFMSRQLNLM
jgi:hypothetical protein